MHPPIRPICPRIKKLTEISEIAFKKQKLVPFIPSRIVNKVIVPLLLGLEYVSMMSIALKERKQSPKKKNRKSLSQSHFKKKKLGKLQHVLLNTNANRSR
jgi:hypothetical protein